ncbi:hypothetical protein [Lentilactobacillus buchneri]|uniref:hypothetical protein n=1 Tax=Lentilactobacillus buchneri TaxID=1581 RepID=UPI0021A41D49|nr:hypothetical protein [Lentilactobacillus buchneri]MCT2881922.1 hypothetical protein [Lentilactobacillus buchneri]
MFDFADMIQEFGIPLEIRMKSGNDDGHYEAGEWVPSTDTTTVKQVNEPLIPPGTNQNQAAVNTQETGGQVSLYDMYWYSEQPNVPMNTVVKELRTGREYKVADASDYTGYSDVTIYGLKAVVSNGQTL